MRLIDQIAQRSEESELVLKELESAPLYKKPELAMHLARETHILLKAMIVLLQGMEEARGNKSN